VAFAVGLGFTMLFAFWAVWGLRNAEEAG
jgi:hypothetical protein